jgi:16S rRNA processing protein RimM
MEAAQDKVCLGVIAGAHGVRGAVRVRSFTARPADIAAYGPLSDETGKRRLALDVMGEARGQLIARIAGIADRDAAEALKGLRLYVARAALPEPGEDEYYHSDLLGLRAETAEGAEFGTVVALHDFGAGDVLEIERADRSRIMLPFSRAAVPVVDLAARRLVVAPPAELLADSEAVDGAEEER